MRPCTVRKVKMSNWLLPSKRARILTLNLTESNSIQAYACSKIRAVSGVDREVVSIFYVSFAKKFNKL